MTTRYGFLLLGFDLVFYVIIGMENAMHVEGSPSVLLFSLRSSRGLHRSVVPGSNGAHPRRQGSSVNLLLLVTLGNPATPRGWQVKAREAAT